MRLCAEVTIFSVRGTSLRLLDWSGAHYTSARLFPPPRVTILKRQQLRPIVLQTFWACHLHWKYPHRWRL